MCAYVSRPFVSGEVSLRPKFRRDKGATGKEKREGSGKDKMKVAKVGRCPSRLVSKCVGLSVRRTLRF